MSFKKLPFLVLFLSIALQAVVPQWHWDSIDVNNLELPAFSTGFRWGVALSEYQNSGASRFPDSNWAHWEHQKFHTDLFGNQYPTIQTGENSGYACDFWQNYPQDIKLIKELGCNSLRISVEWTAIEPVEGQFNQEALDHYKDLIKQCNDAGIDVMVTLYHWTHPWWFEKKGAFENEKNIRYFVRYCTKVFEALHDRVSLWCTINEIGPIVMQGYIRGAFPPGKIAHHWLAMKVMRCLVLAHYETYKTLKQLPGGYEAQIGIVHAYVPFEPHDLGYELPTACADAPTKPLSNWSIMGLPRLAFAKMNLLERGLTAYMSFFFNDQLLSFLKTGTMFSLIPGLSLEVSDAPDCYDFIGLNFYARMIMESNVYGCLTGDVKKGVVFPSCREHEIMSDMQYPVCPESLYCAIQEFSTLGKPIYITENGAPDGKDDRRETWIKRYLFALSQAIRDGYDIRGYYYWSLMDNFEWDEGYAKKFGLYEVNFETQQRRLRDGAKAYQQVLGKLAVA